MAPQGGAFTSLAPKSVGDVLELIGRPPLVAAKKACPKGSTPDLQRHGERDDANVEETMALKKVGMYDQCAALKLLRDAQEVEEARQTAAARRKMRHRREYDIGWRVERIPRNAALADKLGSAFLSKTGRCCLVLDTEGKTLRIAEGMEPASCVNLEYLSLALQVRLHAGREPLFSLEPLARAKDPRRSMQAKRFEPQWLMGTSLGEAMFQADYHLKELSFGEYEQPVIGMKSTFDFSEAEGLGKEWSARAWFVVNNAEVFMTEGNVLVPHVEMGVEARELEFGENGVTDVPMTRPDHPMVKYAAAFTHNFDLIAERKSVVYHLREVAKASILAKFIVEAGIHIDDNWFSLVDWSAVKEAAAGCCLEIPQLWKDRCHSEVRPMDGTTAGAEEGANMNLVSLYGGVEFGLGRFNIAPSQRLPSFVPTEEPARPGLFAPERRALIGRGVNLELISQGGDVLQRATETARAGIRPEGVDLSLEQFNLSEPTRLGGGPEACTGAPGGRDFWAYLDADGTPEDEQRALLKRIFHPSLSDRRSEGELFVCPDASARYVGKLQQLVEEETEVQRQRQAHFFGQGFIIGNAGPKFPSSWSFSDGMAPDTGLRRHLCDHEKVDPDVLRAAAVVFDKSTEDGLRFRVYRHENLEVRTVQHLNAAEVIGAAFSTQECSPASLQGTEQREGRPMKVTIASIGPASEVAKEDPSPNRKVAPAAARRGRMAQLIHSSGGLCGDREVVLAAVEADGLALRRAAAELKADREVVQAAVQQNGSALEFADARLRADRDIVLAAVQQDAAAFRYAAEDLHSNHDIAFAALQGSGSLPDAVAPELRGNRELILAAVHRSAFAFELASDDLRADRPFQLAAVQRNAFVLEVLPREVRADGEFMLQVVKSNGFALKYASPELRAQHELVRAAVAQDGRAAEYADRELREELLGPSAAAAPGEAAGAEAAEAAEAAEQGADLQAPAAGEETIWEVVGGGVLGGIVVRRGEDPSSEALLRLSQGSKVRELELAGERLRFEKLSGEGPATGWVSLAVNGRAMLKPL
mmetsp:Transcript_97273/g.302896  ORF Transcript_97273/g.302896 Transcript_97273/m.302896 type:complete len:1042 (-) Transcript_97273:20-3145(-)